MTPPSALGAAVIMQYPLIMGAAVIMQFPLIMQPAVTPGHGDTVSPEVS